MIFKCHIVVILFLNGIDLTSESAVYRCNFDVDYCGWKRQNQGEKLEWTRGNYTQSSSTGPDFDHTSQNGHFVYTEVSPKNPGDTGTLTSPLIEDGNDTYCLRFWYHMYGDDIGRLDVIRNGVIIFTKAGNKGDRWIEAVIDIPADNYTSFQVEFRSTRGAGYRGDIALDDIEFVSGSCEEMTKTTTSTTTTTTTITTTTVAVTKTTTSTITTTITTTATTSTTTTTTTNTVAEMVTDSAVQDDEADHTGAIAGGAVGGIFIISVVIVSIFCFVRRRRKRQEESGSPGIYDHPYSDPTEREYSYLNNAHHDLNNANDYITPVTNPHHDIQNINQDTSLHDVYQNTSEGDGFQNTSERDGYPHGD